MAQFVADGSPCAGYIEVANVVGHEAGAGREQRDVAAAFLHQTQLVGLNALAQFVVADLQVGHFGHRGWVFDAGNLRIAPSLQRFGGCGVVAVAVDDEWVFHVSLSGFKKLAKGSGRFHALAAFGVGAIRASHVGQQLLYGRCVLAGGAHAGRKSGHNLHGLG